MIAAVIVKAALVGTLAASAGAHSVPVAPFSGSATVPVEQAPPAQAPVSVPAPQVQQQPQSAPQPPEQPQGARLHPQPASAAPTPTGGEAGGVSSPSPTMDAPESANYIVIARYLVAHGYSGAAAAGVVGDIAGESGGNPESVGSGGGGLIGWTPLSSMAQYGGVLGDLQSQEAAVVAYDNKNGDVAALNAQTDPVSAADYYSQTFERPAVTDSDVRPNIAQQVFQALGS